ncbi:MAG: hypothetical protein HS115_16865 [Spirochaetales bacterium]|nr:hypothetical protein [Spirochaetales bacterium]
MTGRTFRTAIFFIVLSIWGCAAPAVEKKLFSGAKMRGLYLPNHLSLRKEHIEKLIGEGKPLGINALVLDAQKYNGRKAILNPEVVPYLKANGIYTVSRVVCFQDGLNKLPLADSRRAELMALIETVAQAGYDEIQLDYIRFADGGVGYSLQKKYDFIEGLLMEARAITDRYKIRLSADIFGRIPYNKNDAIGQQLELFARHTHVLYPMLYPSHFTGDRKRMSDPGGTLTEGIEKSVTRIKAAGLSTGVAPFVQAFGYNIGYARVSLPEYVRLQVEAIEKSEAIGWMAWNAKGDYSSVFAALQTMTAPAAQP